MAELLPISSPLSAERQLDVVFVHGLGGDPINTWRSGTDENTSWPHWLALEFGAQIGVWSLGYAAAPTKWRSLKAAFFRSDDPDAGAAMTLPRRAENALDRLVGAGIGQRPVCFITHSLGGLLVKSILRRAADSQFAQERLQVVQQCRGVLFLATPHHGSRLVDLATAIRVYLPSVSTLDLKDNDDHLMDLYEWYRGYAPSHHILTSSFYENKEIKGLKVVVPRSSADPGVAGETARGHTPLDRDHLEISKPRNRDDQAYIGSKRLILQILNSATPVPAPDQAFAPRFSETPLSRNIMGMAPCLKPIETINQKEVGTVLELVINENLPSEKALEIVKFMMGQMGPLKQARLVYIVEGSTHLFFYGSEDSLRDIHELYRSGALQRLITSPEAPEKLTIHSAELVYDKRILYKAALIDTLINKGAQGSNLSGVSLSGAYLSGANLIEADLSRADLSGADFSGADFSGANLSGANLSGAALIDAHLGDADLGGANLFDADLFYANLSGANLSGAILSGANLSEADLSGADLTLANLSDATLFVANLSGANLSEAYLRGANLTKADFSQANLASCRFGRNEGLTDSQIVDMQRRGALFEDSPESGVPSLVR